MRRTTVSATSLMCYYCLLPAVICCFTTDSFKNQSRAESPGSEGLFCRFNCNNVEEYKNTSMQIKLHGFNPLIIYVMFMLCYATLRYAMLCYVNSYSVFKNLTYSQCNSAEHMAIIRLHIFSLLTLEH